MAWDTEATKRRILDAAVAEFAAHGLDGTPIERSVTWLPAGQAIVGDAVQSR